MHLSWSSVSVYGKASSNSFCHGVSFSNANPCTFCLFAYSSIRFFATSLKFDFTLFFVFSQSFPPNLLILGVFSPPPIYFLILSNDSVGIYKISSPVYFILI